LTPLTDFSTKWHILSHYILLRGVPNLTKTDYAISIIWLRYIMPKKIH